MSEHSLHLPIGSTAEAAVNYIMDNFSDYLDGFSAGLDSLASLVEQIFLQAPWWLILIVVTGFAFYKKGIKSAVGTLLMVLILFSIDLWDESMKTLALVLTSSAISLFIGIPLGILAAKTWWMERVIRPVLDLMQTMPAFVYLIPAAMFFGLGKVPGIIATTVFAMPPAVRLTMLGIQQVPKELSEAGQAFGADFFQQLFKIDLPTAKPSIMAGVNQNIMLGLSMVVIASMIGAGGLGDQILKGIQRLDISLGVEAGFGVVILAVLLDRITQSLVKSS